MTQTNEWDLCICKTDRPRTAHVQTCKYFFFSLTFLFLQIIIQLLNRSQQTHIKYSPMFSFTYYTTLRNYFCMYGSLSLFPTYKKCMVKEMVINYSIHIFYRFYGRRENRGRDTGPASLLYVIWIGNSAVWTCCCWCCDSEHSFVLLLLWFRQSFSAAVRLFTFLCSSIVHQKIKFEKNFSIEYFV